jgi:hypothetical protein
MTSEYRELLVSCWHPDPTIRPAFLEIMTRLSSMVGDSNSNNSFTSKTSSSASTTPKAGSDGSWTLQSMSSNSSDGSDRSRDHSAKWAHHEGGAAAGGGTRAPEGEVTIVFSDITRAASLWEFNAAAMKDATLLHNETLRGLVKEHSGYEVVFVRDRNSGEGSFCVAFQRTEDALKWCMACQQVHTSPPFAGSSIGFLKLTHVSFIIGIGACGVAGEPAGAPRSGRGVGRHGRSSALPRAARAHGRARGRAQGGARSDDAARRVHRSRGQHSSAHHSAHARRSDPRVRPRRPARPEHRVYAREESAALSGQVRDA